VTRPKNIWITLAKVLTDGIFINLAFYMAYWIRYKLQWFREVEPAFFVPYKAFIPSCLSLTGILLAIYWLDGAYSHDKPKEWLDEFYDLFRGTVTGVAIMIVIVFVYRPFYYSRLIFAYAGVFILIFLGLSRAAEKAIRNHLRKRGIGVTRVLIVGAGEVGRTIMRNLVAQPELGYQVVGFVDDAPDKAHTDMGRLKALGRTEDIPEVVMRHDIQEVIITLPWMSHRKIMRIMAQCERQKVHAKIVPDLFQISLRQVDLEVINGIPLLGVGKTSIRGWNRTIKRVMDVIISVILLIVLSPLFLLIALAIRLDSAGPIIFKQVRIGRGGREFVLYKFRTMIQGAEEQREKLAPQNEAIGPLFKIRDDPRRTGVGKFLRRTSMDELPQFYNVLRGDMSLVGPRPPLPNEVEQYKPWHKRRLEVSPGLTGLWQVSGRSDLTFDEMVLLDLYYIENWSLLLDLKIILRTIPCLLLGRGAY